MEEAPARIASLIGLLRHSDKKILREAVGALISIAPEFPHLSDQLNRLLNVTETQSRWPIAYVLAHISSPSPLCLDALREALGSQEPDIRWAIALLLVRLGKGNEGVVRLLLGLLKSGGPIQRRMALYCLRDIDPKGPLFLQALLRSVEDRDPLVRVAAVTSLKAQKGIGREGLDRLLHLFLRDPDSRVRHASALALAQLGAPTPEIRAALDHASRSDDPHLKKAAKAALDLLTKKGPSTIPSGRARGD